MSLLKFKGEDVQQYSNAALTLVDEIHMTAMMPNLIPDLASMVLRGLCHASNPSINSKDVDALSSCTELFDDDGELVPHDPAKVLAAPIVRQYQVLCESQSLWSCHHC